MEYGPLEGLLRFLPSAWILESEKKNGRLIDVVLLAVWMLDTALRFLDA